MKKIILLSSILCVFGGVAAHADVNVSIGQPVYVERPVYVARPVHYIPPLYTPAYVEYEHRYPRYTGRGPGRGHKNWSYWAERDHDNGNHYGQRKHK